MLTVTDHVELLRSSEKFRAWRVVRRNTNRRYLAGERHFTPDELATLWNVSPETVRSIFRNEPGVLKIGDKGTRHKRGYITLRIPEEVVERVHKRLSA